jgi:hypothetical protein
MQHKAGTWCPGADDRAHRSEVPVARRSRAGLGETMGGGVLATVFATLSGGNPLLLMAGTTAAAGAAFALQKTHYAGLTASITATIVLLLSIRSSDAVVNAEHRIAATLLGGGLRCCSRSSSLAGPCPPLKQRGAARPPAESRPTARRRLALLDLPRVRRRPFGAQYGLQVHELVQPERTQFPTVARSLDAAERRFGR